MRTDYNLVDTPYHLAGPWLVTGRARFIHDEPKPKDLQIVKVLASPYAHAKIISIDTSKAKLLKGISSVLTFKDIPGENQIGVVAKDEPLLPFDEVNYIGQPVVIIVAENEEIAESALKLIEVKYKPLEPIFTYTKALEKNSLLGPIRKIEHGNLNKGFAESDFFLEGIINTNSQDHFYLETQICRAIPTEDNEIILHSATQSPSEVQEVAARVLGLKSKDITVDVKRLGGGFGGKERAATIWASLAALACYKTKKPVELRLSRVEDMSWRGKRHPFEIKYKVGFNKKGKIIAYSVGFNLDGGAYADLTMAVLQRAMVHADNTYYIPNVRIIARPCKTNTPPNTALRGFGAPQGIFAIEYVIERIAHKLKIDPIQIRKINSYQERQKTPYGQEVHDVYITELFDRLTRNSQYQKLLKQVTKFNSDNKFVKWGIGVTPVKFGLSFTKITYNQASALVWIYEDGTISVSHGAIEMGQEVNTKIAQIVASEFGVNLNRIRIESNNTKRIGNSTPTAASVCADLNGNAARNAVLQIVSRLKPLAASILKKEYNIKSKPENITFRNNSIFDIKFSKCKINFNDLIKIAYEQRIALGEHGFYKTPKINFDPEKGKGSPFAYFVFGCALSLVEVDILTGNFMIMKTYIVHEMGKSINIAIDRGQIEGAYMQGFGWLTMEELIMDEKGAYITNTPSTYKIPTIKDLPGELNIETIEHDLKHTSVKGSKAIGEPPLIYGESVYFAIKNAIESIADHEVEAKLKIPATPESIIMAVEEIRK
jgi:xanthine dehydrogenase large subunit